MRKILSMSLSALLITGLLAGCGQTGNTPGAASSAQPASSSDTSGPASSGGEQKLVVNGKQVNVIYVASEAASAWQAIGTQYLQSLVEKAGGKCQILNANGDSQKQTQMVQDALVMKPDVLVVKPVDSVGIVPALKKVAAANIPIIALDTGVTGDVKLLTHIQTDQSSLGKTDAEYISKTFKAKGTQAKVVEILGDLTSSIGQQRRDSFDTYAKTAGNIKIVSQTECKWDPDKAYNATLDAFQRNPDANAVFCSSDSMESGVMQALKQLGKLYPASDPKHIVVVSIDADPTGVKYIKEGYTDEIAEHNAALHSDIAYKVIVDYMHGFQIPSAIIFPTTAVTKDNVDDPARWGNMDVSKVKEWSTMDQNDYVMQTK
jgi:ribose transport system substrate-binding protein